MNETHRGTALISLIVGLMIGSVATATLISAAECLKPADWLAFSGSLAGGVMTLVAGVLAYTSTFKVRDLDKRDAVADRLRSYTQEITDVMMHLSEANAFGLTKDETTKFRSKFARAVQSPVIRTMMQDYYLGSDRKAVALFQSVAPDALKRNDNELTIKHHITSALSVKLVNSIEKRISMLENGRPINELRVKSFINLAPFTKAFISDDPAALKDIVDA